MKKIAAGKIVKKPKPEPKNKGLLVIRTTEEYVKKIDDLRRLAARQHNAKSVPRRIIMEEAIDKLFKEFENQI